MVFQDYALYPHLTVAENVGFGLRTRKVPAAERTEQVDRVTALLGIGDLLDRYPDQLSGGQQQRVALARCMVREPAVQLMDEPLSNLDAQLRLTTRADIVDLQRRLGTTTVYVTHDQAEAMTMGDRVAVLADGSLQQVGTPEEVYDRPANRFVAGFLGGPPMNLVEGGGALGGEPSEVIGVRPEDLRLDPQGAVHAVVSVVEALGSETVLRVHATDGTPLFVRTPPRGAERAGDLVRLAVDPARVHRFDVVTGRRR
jgi:ABC-type sugar transport system ATPase subunit